MITRRGAPETRATPLAARLLAALRGLFVCFVLIYHTVEISKYAHVGHKAYRSPIHTADGRCPVVTEI
jgi:hypothetical protein